MLFEILFFGAAILAGGIVVAWAIETILPVIKDYLNKTDHIGGIFAKGPAINDLIKNTKDPELRRFYDEVKKQGKALFLPGDSLNKSHTGFDSWALDDTIVLQPDDVSGEDRMPDAAVIFNDGSYQYLSV